MVNENDVIIFNNITKMEYDNAIKHAVSYGILSVPYTYDRLGLGNSRQGIKQRITNITKGKIGEFLFELYCKKNNIEFSRDHNETPFWKYDKNDFHIGDMEFDLKNNIIHGQGINPADVPSFPALIPERQFKHSNKDNFWYVFSFMCRNDFFNIELNDDTLDFISQINNGCSGKELNNKPSYYTTAYDFYINLFKRFGKQKVVTINDNPPLIIGGMINKKYGQKYNLFNEIEKNTVFSYQSGYMKTKVKNYMTKVKNLQPFKF